MITAPKTGTCYCGCDQLEGPDTIAQRVLLAGYGPSGRNLRQAAREARLTG
jgi:hypothetical protein